LKALQLVADYSEYYDIQSILGHGAFCTVYKALDKRKNQLIALKVIKRKTLCKETIELLRKEADLQHSL